MLEIDVQHAHQCFGAGVFLPLPPANRHDSGQALDAPLEILGASRGIFQVMEKARHNDSNDGWLARLL